MAESLGEGVLRLRVDSTQFDAGINRSKQEVNQFGAGAGSAIGPVQGLSAGMASLGAIAATIGIGAIAAQFLSMAQSMIAASGEAQRLTASFTALGGSAQVAAQLRDQLFQLSKTTPFKNEEILETSRRFLAVGVSVGNLNGTINRLGALAAQSGQSLDRIGLIYSQVFAKGRLQGEENLQFLEAGIDLTGALSKVTGLYGTDLQTAMSKGQIGISAVNKAIVLATGDMGALVQGGKAVDVALNNIGDNAGQVGLALSNSIAPAFSAAFGVINSAFDRLFPNLAAVEAAFKPLTDEADRFAKLLEGNPALVDAVASAFDSLLTLGIDKAVLGLKGINTQLEKNPRGLIDTVIELELGIRRAAIGAIGLAKVISSGARPGGFLNEDSRKQFLDGIKDIRESFDQKPLEIQSRVAPPTQGTEGILDNKAQQQASADAAKAAKELQLAGRSLEAAFFAGKVTASLIGKEGLERSTIQGASTLAEAGLNLRNAINDGVSGPALNEFGEKIKGAALSFKDTLVSGIKQAQQGLEDAKQSLLGLRLDNSRFQSPEERSRNTAQLNADFQRAQQISGRTVNITGSQSFVQSEQRAFIDFVKNEGRGQNNVDTLQKGLEVATNTLAETNNVLNGNITALAGLIPGLTNALNAIGQRESNFTFLVNAGQTIPVPTGIN